MTDIFKIFVPDNKAEKFVSSLLIKRGVRIGLGINRAMFV